MKSNIFENMNEFTNRLYMLIRQFVHYVMVQGKGDEIWIY